MSGQNNSSGSAGAASGMLASWRTDLPASIVVALVALPLCLGVALASGAPLFAGLIAGIVGGIVVGCRQPVTAVGQRPGRRPHGHRL